MKKITCLFWTFYVLSASAQQVHGTSTAYTPPSDSLVREKLSQWQDLKFGFMIHWGAYSQWGITESWTLSPDSKRTGPYSANYFEYKKAYENLLATFNPTKFNPEKWALAAKDAGMKYVVFTTKHHDGFCMFDTKQTDYKITSSRSPFSSNPRSNVAREVFNVFRKEGFKIGTYFSKPDWHSENYWWSYFPPYDANVNYDPAKYPERWQAFKDYTFNQIKELMTGYGSVDILWLDGGWVRPNAVDPKPDKRKKPVYNQDINMPGIAKMARSYQPGLLVVDRTVPGEYENYLTPEQYVPEKPLEHPWESCVTMGRSWSYRPDDVYKPTNQIVQLLVKTVSRGGNLLLNVGPLPTGELDDTAYSRLKEIGAWIKINGEGIYATQPLAPYSSDNLFFTQSKDGKTVFAFYLPVTKDVVLPSQVTIGGYLPANQKATIQLLGFNDKLKWKQDGDKLVIDIPAKLQGKTIAQYAVAFRISN